MRDQAQASRYLMAGLGLLLALSILGCSGSSQDGGKATVPEEEVTDAVVDEPSGGEDTVALSDEDTVTLKVMSFNVLYGAGVDRRFDMNIPQSFWGRDRLPELLAFLREVNPDILSVQEAGGWESGSPSVSDRIASMLGMTYVIARDPWDLHVILFSKFPIIETEYVSRTQGFNGVVLRATLAVTPTAKINVLATHLNSMSSQTRACQVEALLDIASRLGTERTLIVGDMNFRPTSAQAQQLTSKGWQLVVAQERWPIDQIWADPQASVSKGDWWSAFNPPPGISDHSPVGVDITFSTPRSSIRPTNGQPAAPRALNYACAA